MSRSFPAYAFSDRVGGWLASQPYRIDLAVMERLLRTAVPEFASDRAVAPEYGAAMRRRLRRGSPPPVAVLPPARPWRMSGLAPASPQTEDDWADLSSWRKPVDAGRAGLGF